MAPLTMLGGPLRRGATARTAGVSGVSRSIHAPARSAFRASPSARQQASPPPPPPPPQEPQQHQRTERGAEQGQKRPTFANLFGEAPTSDKSARHRTQYNYDPFSEQPNQEHYGFPLVTAEWLSKQKDRPRGVRMLARDFIDDSLYNPHYGYFSRHAVLLPEDRKRGRLLDLAAYKDERAFMMAIEERYQAFEDELKSQDERSTVAEGASSGESTSPTAGKEPLSKPSPKPQGSSPQSPAPKRRVSQPMPGSRESLERAQLMGKLDQARRRLSAKEAGEHDRDVKAMAARQVWHTPTQLFKPHYAHAIARYMLAEKEADKPLRVYEVGAGSGALASDILDFVENAHPEIYASMQYHIIEISPRLAEQQQRALARHISAGRAEVTNKSVFDWNTFEPDACFFIALEVFDNLTHDVVRYTTDTLQPYQAVVSIDASGDMHELWEPVHDARIKRYFELTGGAEGGKARFPPAAPGYLGWTPQAVRKFMTAQLPFYPNLTPPQYIPTGSIALLDVLAKSFPKHRLVMADFDKLPDTIDGHNAPVVQTRLQGTMVPVTQYLVHQGFFDIFFPTNFGELQRMHSATMSETGRSSSSSSSRHARSNHAPPAPLSRSEVLPHSAFLRRYADLAATTCWDGSNPMLTWYANASWFLS